MAYFTVNRELVDPDYHDGVVASRKEDLLFQNLVGRIKGQPVDWEQKVQVKAFPKARDAAVAEGVDFNRANVAEYTDFVLAHVMEIFRSEGYRVSRHREKMPGHNDRRGMTRRDRMYADLAEAVGVTGAAIDDLKRMTPAMLDRALRHAWELNRWEFKDGEDTRASVAWHALLEEIRGKSAAYHIENRSASTSKTASASRIPGQDGDLSQRRLNDGDDVRNPLTSRSISNG